MKNNIEFKAGYYEWNVWKDDQIVYTIGADILDDLDEDATENDLEVLANACIETMQEHFEEQELELWPEDWTLDLNQAMIEAWAEVCL